MPTLATPIADAETESTEVERAYLEIVRRSPLGPREHLDALFGALVSAHPDASVLEMASWLTTVAR